MKCLRTGPVSEYMNDSADSCIVAHDDMKLQFFSADFFYGDKTLLLPHLVKSNYTMEIFDKKAEFRCLPPEKKL